MSNSKIRTTLLHLQDFDDHDDQKLISNAVDFRINHRNIADAMGLVLISEFDMKTWWIIFYSVCFNYTNLWYTLSTILNMFKKYLFFSHSKYVILLPVLNLPKQFSACSFPLTHCFLQHFDCRFSGSIIYFPNTWSQRWWRWDVGQPTSCRQGRTIIFP